MISAGVIDRYDVETTAARLDSVYFTHEYLQIDEPQPATDAHDLPTTGVTPFHLWPSQRTVMDTLRAERMVLMLKARQLGISWVVCAYALHTCLFNAGQQGLIFSKGQLEANELIRRINVMYLRLPEWMRARLPALMRENSSELAWSNGSRVLSLPATPNAGRSLTASFVVLDEAAFLAWAEQLYTALKPTIDGGGKLIILSTANGVGNLFHRLWNRAAAGYGSFTPIFLPWTARPGRDAAWYQRVVEDADDPATVPQEYPATPEEAFLVTGQVRFAKAWLDYQTTNYARPALPFGRWADAGRWADTLPAVLADIPGLAIWTPPQPGRRYVMGADVAEGIAGGDYDACAIWEAETWDQVAELHGLWEPEEYAEFLAVVGDVYRADALVERNQHGHAAIARLRRLRYPRIGLGRDGRAGWVTNQQTKPQMIDQLAGALKDHLCRIRSRAAIAELLVYRKLDGGKTGAPAGYNDDRVMSQALALQAAIRPVVQPTRQSNYLTGSNR